MLFWIVSGFLLLALLILFLPLKGAGKYGYSPPRSRYHEADAVLSRRLLAPGTADYEAYYQSHPDYKLPDDRSRAAPGLLDPRSRYYHPETYAAARANFRVIDHLAELITPPLPAASTDKAPDKIGHVPHPGDQGRSGAIEAAPAHASSRFIRHWLEQTGAHSVGFTALKDYHLYSHKGRGPSAGKPIELLHNHAIAITVEMDHRMLRSAPEGTAVMESSEQYLRSGVLALKLAAWIQELGYQATAHIDGNYELICPLVAVDAGLGTIGRMGLLMTPGLGPRVRISVVTTDMPLDHDPPRPDRTMLHFCDRCLKCAENCPVGAIPREGRKEDSGVPRWQINSEKCYHFWTVSGTDCGRCMSVCPYAHRDDAFHRFIRWGIKNNLVFRHLALKLDDVFYGRKPGIRPMPTWANRQKP
jgi:ferredoxin